MTNMIKYTDDDRQSLINLIAWYRDEYHKQDFGHTEMMEEIKTAEDLESYYQTLDGWLG